MDSIQIKIKASGDDQEILISKLEEFSSGFEQTEEELIAYFDEMNFESYSVKQILYPYEFQMDTLKDRNWNEEWERNFEPISVGNFCGIRADFHPPITHVKYELTITPKMSFGTGHHATTYMMIDQMSRMDLSGKSVLDFGTGTGILAILAAKMGASKIVAIDNDQWSIENAKENIVMNNCVNIDVVLSSELPNKQFDIILANINKNVLLENMKRLKSCLNANGMLLMSGLLRSDEKEITEACQAEQLELKNKGLKDNWISVLYMNCK